MASSCATSVFRNVLLADSMQSDLVVVRHVCDHTPCIANLLASSFVSASVRPVSLPVLVQTLTHVLSQFVRRCKVMRGAEKGRNAEARDESYRYKAGVAIFNMHTKGRLRRR